MKSDLLCNICCVAGALLVANLAELVAAQAPAPSDTVITIAGNGVGGFSGDGGPALDAIPRARAKQTCGQMQIGQNESGTYRLPS